MSETWFLLDWAAHPPEVNMAWDEALLENVNRLGRPVLRFYGWTQPAATFGYFQKYEDIASWTPLRPLIRRPTGGGLVPHDREWTYSLAFPSTHFWHELPAVESYRRVHDWLRLAFERLKVATELAPAPSPGFLGQCFLGAEKFDLLAQGSKIAGAAQRRNRCGLLVQGSVQARSPTQHQAWMEAVRATGPAADWLVLEPDETLRGRVDQLVAEKYSLDGYNRKR